MNAASATQSANRRLRYPVTPLPASSLRPTRADRLFVCKIKWRKHQIWREPAETTFDYLSNIFDQTRLSISREQPDIRIALIERDHLSRR